MDKIVKGKSMHAPWYGSSQSQNAAGDGEGKDPRCSVGEPVTQDPETKNTHFRPGIGHDVKKITLARQ